MQLTIDWGDGSAPFVLSDDPPGGADAAHSWSGGTTLHDWVATLGVGDSPGHVYSAPGDYIITCTLLNFGTVQQSFAIHVASLMPPRDLLAGTPAAGYLFGDPLFVVVGQDAVAPMTSF